MKSKSKNINNSKEKIKNKKDNNLIKKPKGEGDGYFDHSIISAGGLFIKS